MQKIVFASGNKKKYIEIKNSFSHANLKLELVMQSKLNIPDIEETGMCFVENAILKARNATKLSRFPAFGDDSGLIVPTLNGEPGVFSARYAGNKATDDDNISKLLNSLGDNTERAATFVCVIAFLIHEKDPTPQIFQANWHGQILKEKIGINGFGYDPIFYVPTHNCTAAELDLNIKNKISHRGQALIQLQNFLSKRCPTPR